MKKLRSIGCLIVLILSVLNLKIALGQGEESLNNDQDVTLEVDGGFLTLMIPAEYQYQTVELTELERYPFSYTFMNEETGIRFTVYSTLHSQKDQSHFLKKLYDKSNRYIVFEDVLIGGYTYIVYTIEQATYDYGFLVRTDNGYSYQFQYALPYDRIQNEIPEDAISILSTMVIHETPIPDQLGMENRVQSPTYTTHQGYLCRHTESQSRQEASGHHCYKYLLHNHLAYA